MVLSLSWSRLSCFVLDPALLPLALCVCVGEGHDKTRTRQGKARQDKTRQDKSSCCLVSCFVCLRHCRYLCLCPVFSLPLSCLVFVCPLDNINTITKGKTRQSSSLSLSIVFGVIYVFVLSCLCPCLVLSCLRLSTRYNHKTTQSQHNHTR